MKLYDRICVNCGFPFKAKRENTGSCSKKCAVSWSMKKKNGPRTSEVRECKMCETKFFATRSDHYCCSSKCSSSWTRLKRMSGEKMRGDESVKNPTKSKEVNVEDLIKKEIIEWVTLVKKRGGWITEVDLYRLVHYYDLLWPIKPKENGREGDHNIELFKKWFKLQQWMEQQVQQVQQVPKMETENETRNQKLLKELKKKYPDLNIDKGDIELSKESLS